MLNATDRRDKVKVDGDADAVEVKGLPAKVNVLHPEARDSVEINGVADRDRVESKLAAGTVKAARERRPASVARRAAQGRKAAGPRPPGPAAGVCSVPVKGLRMQPRPQARRVSAD